MSHSLSVNFFTKQNEKHTSTEPCEVNKQDVLLQVSWRNDPLPTLHPRVLRHSGPWRQYFFVTPLPGTEFWLASLMQMKKWHTEINRNKWNKTHTHTLLSHVVKCSYSYSHRFPHPSSFGAWNPWCFTGVDEWRIRPKAIIEQSLKISHAFTIPEPVGSKVKCQLATVEKSWNLGSTHQLREGKVVYLPLFLLGFIHPRWCQDFWNINSITVYGIEQTLGSFWPLAFAFIGHNRKMQCHLQCGKHPLDSQHSEAKTCVFVLLFQLPTFHWNFGSTNCCIWPWMSLVRDQDVAWKDS